MKRLLMLFVVLSVLSTLCTGRTISRAFCEKIPSCKHRTITTSSTIQPTQEPPQMIDMTHHRNQYESLPNLMETVICPGGAPKLRSGMCSSSERLTWPNYDDIFYRDV